MGGNGEPEELDVGIAAVPLSVPGLDVDHVRMEDLLVLSVHQGNGDRGVVEEEMIGLPCMGCTVDPVDPFLEEEVVEGLDVVQPEVNGAVLFARPAAVEICRGEHRPWMCMFQDVWEMCDSKDAYNISVAKFTSRRVRGSGYVSLQEKSLSLRGEKAWAKNMMSMRAWVVVMAEVGALRRGHAPVALRGWSRTSHLLGTMEIQACSSMHLPIKSMRPLLSKERQVALFLSGQRHWMREKLNWMHQVWSMAMLGRRESRLRHEPTYIVWSR